LLEVARCCAGVPDERASVEVYSAVWPHAAITINDDHSFKASVRDHADCQTCIDGATVGSDVIQVPKNRRISITRKTPKLRGLLTC
jgi:hypothetical protein